MSATNHLLFYIAIPLLLGGGSLALMRLTDGNAGGGAAAEIIIASIALLLAVLPAIFYRLFIQSQLQQGFARLADGELRLPDELAIGDLLSDRIDSWVPYHHSLKVSVCLQGHNEKIHVQLRLRLEFTADQWGKSIARHLDKVLPHLQQTVQHRLYIASQMDRELACSLDGSKLLNEDEERVLRSKFLSALETIQLQGVHFPTVTSGIDIDRNVRKVPQKLPMSTLSNSALDDEFDTDALELDDTLLKELGIG